MYENWKFERWRTPISDARFPVMESLTDDGERLTIIVSVGDDIRVRFTFADFPAYRNIQELYRTKLWEKLHKQDLGSTLIIADSAWIEEFRDDREALDACHPNAVHYMINTEFGCVEVLSAEPPMISVEEEISNSDWAG